MTEVAVQQVEIPGLSSFGRGKVRDIFDLGDDRLLAVTTDRISVNNVIFPTLIPGRGKVLNRLSAWWFRRTEALVPNHFITDDFEEFPESLTPYHEMLEGRSMIVHKTKPVEAEFIIRGYLDGSAWRSYEFNKSVLGHELLAGLRPHSTFGMPLFTPNMKEHHGHDRALDLEDFARLVGRENAEKGRGYTSALYVYAHNFLHDRGLIVADAKFEFGRDSSGELILIDELLTPDSARFFLRDGYSPASQNPVSLDKQYFRDWCESVDWNFQAPAPDVPDEIVEELLGRYLRTEKLIMEAAQK